MYCNFLVCIVFSCLVSIVVVVLCVLLYSSCVYCCNFLLCIVVVLLFVLLWLSCALSSYVYLLYYVCIAVITLDAGLLVRSQYSEGPATGHIDTGFSWFPCVYKQMLRWFPTYLFANTCFICSPSDLKLLVKNFMFFIHV